MSRLRSKAAPLNQKRLSPKLSASDASREFAARTSLRPFLRQDVAPGAVELAAEAPKRISQHSCAETCQTVSSVAPFQSGQADVG